ncbi:hypothetical protein CsSME_00000034 [Camellia sinensis var. sinensis]
MRAKVADFGLVRLAPDGNVSVETKLAGTFGYLAPEYAETGRVTTKSDVYSFGVILMELITGRKALDQTQKEESVHLVTWFRRMYNKDTFQKAIDPTIDLDEETLASVSTVAELAGHCCARDSSQRPDMGHAVNVLSSLTELWKPSDPDADDIYGVDFDMTLPQSVKKWQALDTSSSALLGSGDNTQGSIPNQSMLAPSLSLYPPHPPFGLCITQFIPDRTRRSVPKSMQSHPRRLNMLRRKLQIFLQFINKRPHHHHC